MLKPSAGEGYFDDVFAIDGDGKRLAVIRTDGATFSKLEIVDAGSGKPLGGFDLPSCRWSRSISRSCPANGGVVLIGARPARRARAPLRLSLRWHRETDGGKVGPATAFGRPPADGTARAKLLVAFTRKIGTKGAEATFTVAPYDIATLAPTAEERVHKVDVTGELKPPGVRFIGFFDGYTRVLSRAPGSLRQDRLTCARRPKMAVVDAISGKIEKEGPIGDIAGWAQTGQLRRRTSGVRCSSSSMRTGRASM